MHLEINAGGLGGAFAVSEYQSDMKKYISDTDGVISSFKAVKNSTYGLSGGVGNLQGAVNELSTRIRKEENKKQQAKVVAQKTNDFLELAIKVDKQVAKLVNKNKDEFYKVNPWLRPPYTVDSDAPWYEKAWNWICKTGDQIGKDLEKAWDWVSDTAKKAWAGIKEFYNEHKKLIDTILIVVGAVAAIAAVVFSGGTALAPLLAALGLSASTAAAISSAVAVVAVTATALSSVLNIADIWMEIDNPFFNTTQKVLNITALVSNGLYSIGSLYNSVKGINPQDFVAKTKPVKPTKPITDVNQLSGKQINAIESYSGNDYININQSLRGVENVTPQNARTIETMRSTLSNASLPDDMTLYRGTTIDTLGDLKNLDPSELIGRTFPEKGFMSTSTDPAIAKAFTGDLHITINAPRGAHGLNITSISRHPNETEILFNAGQKMSIISAEKINGILRIIVNLKK